MFLNSNKMVDNDFTAPETSVPLQVHNEKPSVALKNVLIGAALFSIITVMSLIGLNTNKALKIHAGGLPTYHVESDVIDLVIIIYTASSHNYRRRTIRETWLNSKDLDKLNGSVKHLFIIGNRDMTITKSVLLKKEAKFDDIVTVPVYDDVTESPLKLMQTFKWLHEKATFRFKYLLKCNDATYVRIDKLLTALKELEQNLLAHNSSKNWKKASEAAQNYITVNIQSNAKNSGRKTELELYWGYFTGSSAPSSIDYDWILCDYFLPHAAVNAYVLSHKLVAYLVRNKNIFRYYGQEDVSLGAWLGPVNNVVRVHDRRFNPDAGCKNYFIIWHNLSIFLMHDIYERLSTSGEICVHPHPKQMEYNYTWKHPPSLCCSSKIIIVWKYERRNNFSSNIQSTDDKLKQTVR